MARQLDQYVLVRFQVVGHHVDEQLFDTQVDDVAQGRVDAFLGKKSLGERDDALQLIKTASEGAVHAWRSSFSRARGSTPQHWLQ
ncbi:hypothetical protein D3C83_52150 [compost metagenome]